MPMFSEEAIQSCCDTYFESIGATDVSESIEIAFATGIRYAAAIMEAKGINVEFVVVNEVRV
jgi:hypothetical protein